MGEKARHEARYFPHGERSLFTSPLSESAPTGASEKKFRFSCTAKVTRARTVLLVQLLFAAALQETYLQSVTLQNNLKVRENLCSHFLKRSGSLSIQIERLTIRWNSSSLKVLSILTFLMF